MSKNKKEIILGVTGSIAAYKACDIIRRLKEKGFNVTVIMTKESEEFVTARTFSALSQNKVYEGMFEAPEEFDIEHVSLAQKAGLILVAPATANLIAKLACGVWDDLLTCTIGASKAKVLIAPAMNENMYLNKITQGNIQKLKTLGYKFIEPQKGNLACNKAGWGCLAKVETIVETVLKNISG